MKKAKKKARLQKYIISVADGCLSGCDSENPLESWTHFIDQTDAEGRRHIGDALERNGRNRYTGQRTE